MSENARGAIAMSLAMAAFSINDMLVKLVLGAMPMGQTMVLRGAMSALLGFLMLRAVAGLGRIRDLAHPAVLLRSGFECAAMIFFMAALANISIATLIAVLQAMPLIATAQAAILLKEPVGWRRWLATIVGLIGVLIIVAPVGPDAQYEPMALFGLAAAFFAASRDIATRFAPRETPTLLLAFSIILGGVLTGIGVSAFESAGGDPWRAVSLVDWGRLFLAAIALITAHYLVSRAMRIGELSFVAPFRYVMVLWAILWSWAIFAEPPGPRELIGMAIVVGAGLYTLHREQAVRRQLRREARAAADSATRSAAPGE